MKIDCVAIVEACYVQAPSTEDWLGGLLAPFAAMDQGSGLLARQVSLGGSVTRHTAWASRGVPPAILAAFQAMSAVVEGSAADVARSLYAPPPSVCWISHRGARLAAADRARLRACLAGTGMSDALGIAAIEPGGAGLLLNIPCRREVSVPPRTIRQLTRVTAHLCSALRLRARSSGAPAGPGTTGVEAVLDPRGRLCHAEGPARDRVARDSLAAAARRVERARGSLRRVDPEEALDLWQALLDGRWSLLDHTEADGRRLLLARRNEPGVRDPVALAPAERDVLAYAALGHSNKYIGYLLGAPTSTVASRLAAGLRKLGLASRREAIGLFGLSARTPPTPRDLPFA